MIYLIEDDNNIRELVVYTLGSVGLQARFLGASVSLESTPGKGTVVRVVF